MVRRPVVVTTGTDSDRKPGIRGLLGKDNLFISFPKGAAHKF